MIPIILIKNNNSASAWMQESDCYQCYQSLWMQFLLDLVFSQMNRTRLRRWKQRTIVSSPAVTPHRRPRLSRQPGHPPRPPAPPHPPRVSPWGYRSITSTSLTPSCQVSSVSALVSAVRQSGVSVQISVHSLFWEMRAVSVGVVEVSEIYFMSQQNNSKNNPTNFSF